MCVWQGKSDKILRKAHTRWVKILTSDISEDCQINFFTEFLWEMMTFANYSNVFLLTTSDIVGSDISVSDISAPRPPRVDLFFLMISSKLMSILSVILEFELKLNDEMALDFL